MGQLKFIALCFQQNYLAGAVMAMGVPFTVKLINDLNKLGINYTEFVFWVLGVLGLVLGVCLSHMSKVKGSKVNWENWAFVANNKAIGLVVLLFTLSPMILKLGLHPNINYQPNLIFYSYWFCGLNFFFFILFIKVLAPKVYKFSDYSDFIVRSGSFIHLRDEISEVISNLDKLRDKDKDKDPYLDSDIKILKSIGQDNDLSLPDAYEILRKRSSYIGAYRVEFVGIFILIPVYILPLLFIANITLVATEASNLLYDTNSYVDSIFGS